MGKIFKPGDMAILVESLTGRSVGQIVEIVSHLKAYRDIRGDQPWAKGIMGYQSKILGGVEGFALRHWLKPLPSVEDEQIGQRTHTV